jgi:23S rRNA (uracil1939-C5)-methyltransferase
LAKVENLAVFIDGAYPGDLARVRVTRKKKNYAEARVLEILTPSPQRTPPACSYAEVCGGCRWQGLSYETQTAYKRRHVQDALAHIALIRGANVAPTIPAAHTTGYRNKMEFTVTDRRWLMPEEMPESGAPAEADRDPAVGLHVPGTFYKVLDIKRCLLQPETGNDILDLIRRYIRNSHRPPYGLKTHQGFWRFVVLRQSAAHQHWMVNLVTTEHDPETVKPLTENLVREFPEITTVVNNITRRKAGVAVGESEYVLIGGGKLVEQLGDYTFEISANSFFQTHTAQAVRLFETVAEFAALTGRETVFDLYSGAGAISIFLSGAAGRVIGMEAVGDAVEDAENNRRKNNIDNCRFIIGDVREQLARQETGPDVVIVDPPRAGLHKEVAAQIAAMRPPTIVYVSCNPATLARDLSLWKEHYRLEAVQPIDMFPHTPHVESVARLVLAG